MADESRLRALTEDAARAAHWLLAPGGYTRVDAAVLLTRIARELNECNPNGFTLEDLEALLGKAGARARVRREA